MSANRLEDFRNRLTRRLERDPPTTAAATRVVVEDLLVSLGWDPHGTCPTDVEWAGTTLEYVPRLAGVPALAVAVERATDPIHPERRRALERCMQASGLDRALYTNGRSIVLFAGNDPVEAREGDLREPATLATLADHYAKESLEGHLGHHTRDLVGRQLALGRGDLRATILEELVSVAGTAYETELERATDRFLGDLVGSFRTRASPGHTGQSRRPGGTSIGSESSRPSAQRKSADGDPRAERADLVGSIGADERGPAEDEADGDEFAGDRPDNLETEGTTTNGDPMAMTDTERKDRAGDAEGAVADDDGEYVVRVFGEHGSIGAVGHSTPDGALEAAAEFLFERGLSGLRVPWPEAELDGDEAQPAILVEQDAADRLTEGRLLSNGLALEVAGSTDEIADRVEGLAARAGFRVMLTGDWDEGDG